MRASRSVGVGPGFLFFWNTRYIRSSAGLLVGAEEMMRAKHSGVCFFNEPTVSVNYYYY